LLRTCWLQASSNLLWFSRVAADGRSLITDFTHATDEMMQAIESYDIVEEEDESGVTQRRIRLKLKPSAPALALLGKALGLDQRHVLIQSRTQQQAEIKVSYVQSEIRNPHSLLREMQRSRAKAMEATRAPATVEAAPGARVTETGVAPGSRVTESSGGSEIPARVTELKADFVSDDAISTPEGIGEEGMQILPPDPDHRLPRSGGSDETDQTSNG
jgi:hypothetical protein